MEDVQKASCECVVSHPLFTLKTNLLYDALTALNVEVEVPIGQRWSVAVEDVFPWWKNGNKWAFQMWEVGAEGRYWFKRTSDTEVLIGHFAGVYGMGAKYDFQNRHKGCYQGEYWSLGLTYGYAMAIGTHWNLEFSISLGYLSTDYRHYCPAEGWTELVRDRRKEGVFEYVGPTKVKVSLIYPIRMGSRKKGGCHD